MFTKIVSGDCFLQQNTYCFLGIDFCLIFLSNESRLLNQGLETGTLKIPIGIDKTLDGVMGCIMQFFLCAGKIALECKWQPYFQFSVNDLIRMKFFHLFSFKR